MLKPAGQERTALVQKRRKNSKYADAGYTVDPTPVPETVTGHCRLLRRQLPLLLSAERLRRSRTPEPPPEVETVPPAVTPVPAQPTPLPPIDGPPATGTVGE
ncbi:MAG: hypothetical protein IPG56_20660 [Caulobacteraceae bacterium]|nr:hypothetical protein [Caulobacteraceae bacterium]